MKAYLIRLYVIGTEPLLLISHVCIGLILYIYMFGYEEPVKTFVVGFI